MFLSLLKRWIFGRKAPGERQPNSVAVGDESPNRSHHPPSWHRHATTSSPSRTVDDAIEDQSRRLVEIVNDSLRIARDSIDPETRMSRLVLAEKTLVTLEKLSFERPQIRLYRLPEVRSEIDKLRNVFTVRVSLSAEELQKAQGALPEVNGQPTYTLSHKKDDLDVMRACMRAEIDNYWQQPEGFRMTAAPFFFERVAILERKAKNYDAEVAACEAWILITEDYKSQDFVKNGRGAKVWLGTLSRKITERLPKAKELLSRQK